ncbi:MAG: 1-deoxy-D-xylulose-5-phosphate reductoisomerase [Luteibaculaceae bacterium]
MEKKGVAILGSTGSIGTQALEVIEANPELYSVEVLTAGTNAKLLLEQAEKFRPNCVVIGSEELWEQLKDPLFNLGVNCYCGSEALCEVVTLNSVDVVLTALVGYAGLKPTIAAINAGKHIALANKETLVVAGALITKLAKEKGVNIYPVDSEHSAIFQCLVGEFHNPIEKIILTASGGPFRGYNLEQLQKVSIKQALKHPNWAMGAKITIDSATLMNKGLEVIEAKWLFALEANQIDVVVHPQSIIHSMVQFTDGSIKAQMGLPDMKLPIQFALAYPNRTKNDFPRFSFAQYPSLTFEEPNRKLFENLNLAFEALHKGGNAPCVLNAANEVTNKAFLDGKISFLDIGRINSKCLEKATFTLEETLSAYESSDAEARAYATEFITKTTFTQEIIA